jgi:transcriptional regulator with XRE-family HTH domain
MPPKGNIMADIYDQDQGKLRTDMVKLSELKTAAEVRADDMQDLAYRREYERTRLANDIAIKVLHYRHAHGLSQTELASRLGMRQPNIARLEAGDHSPTLDTLARLADVLKIDLSIEVKPGKLRLRNPGQASGATVTAIGGPTKPARPAAPGRRRAAALAVSSASSETVGPKSATARSRKSESPRRRTK